ncbi:MAG: hypothetical protein COU35_05305 [Candidatus Magasanikbacteria bacterium CG10_big_fil_rev_8_21_14_0_10_47_10]|uniref:DUF3147 domain-containing protein n=1 Tax=Candidatus Magasanikbacteria bacterium CG10_big_fil_rev_8_21_14_0_10_47_10 TaxID=1974652 RepID=A0A2H0TP31_9BACT|nr:MAG: hypothetical protein COU35_05305 [Candidatus Magasanikbacteria bacterium CG10_big_fil_rev_8_21_14_0_10_47_10]
MQYLIKTIITAIVVVGIAEIGKKFSPIAAILASLPLTSILAMIWLYTDTKDVQKVIDLSSNIFWAVLPSLIFFLFLPLLLKNGFKFGIAMVLSTVIMFIAYSIYVVILQKVGIKF